jgi:Tol biopolymer transport system component
MSNVAGLIALAAAEQAWGHGFTERVSVGSGGVQSNGSSSSAALSAEARLAVFISAASNLVRGDTNGAEDIFVRDRLTGTTRRVSVGSGGVQGNGNSTFRPAVSPDGRLVAFTSTSTNLVPDDTKGQGDVFVHDLRAGITQRVSVGSDGAQSNGFSRLPAMSADGRFIAFQSFATNLVPGDTNGSADVFVHDRVSGTTLRVSVGSGGVQGDDDSFVPAISANGRFIAFASAASNLVRGDTNGTSDVFVRDRRTGTTVRVSLGQSGAEADNASGEAAISADGRFVAFASFASNLAPDDTNGVEDVFVRDRQVGTTERVSLGRGDAQADGHSFEPAISADGLVVAFVSIANNLVTGDTNTVEDVFVHDRSKGITRRVSLGQGNAQGNGPSREPAISAGGRFVAFHSGANTLVPVDTNDEVDVFVRDR